MLSSSPLAFRSCTVSFIERGQRFEAKVDAETAYEAAALALKQFGHGRHARSPGRNAVLDIEVTAPRRIQLKVSDVLEWLYTRPARTPEQQERKKRLRGLLADERH